jgi:hypothetical protein
MSLPDPVYHGVFEREPPKKAASGDTCVLKSAYHPGTYEVLMWDGLVGPRGYEEMWIYMDGKMSRPEAEKWAKAAVL